MARKSTPHIRRPWPLPVMCMLRMDCDCGWRGEVPETAGKEALDRLFVEHIPEGERQTYVLVEQRPGFEPGNWIMPEGKPVLLKQWREKDGIYRGVVQGFELGDKPVLLPIGEIRTQDGRIFAFD